MSMNIAMIQGAGKTALGRDVSNDEAQNIMNATGGGDEGQVQRYFAGGQAQNQAGDLAAQQKGALDTKFAADKQSLSDFNTRYQQGTNDAISQTSQKYNLGGLLNLANGLGDRVNNLAGNLTGEGAGGYASGAQVDKAIQTNYLPRYQQAVSNLQSGTQLAQNEEQTRLQPLQTEGNLLNDRMAREATAYTSEQQNELQALIAKIQAGTALTTTEMNNANALALKHIDYEAALQTTKINNSNVTLPAGATYYNPGSGIAYNPFVNVSR